MKSETLEQLRQWGEHRRHFDATREQPAMGQALLDLIDEREDWMRRAAIAGERAERAEERAEHLREALLALMGRTSSYVTEQSAWKMAEAALAADDATEDDA